jgi:hypothetical protein
VVTLPNKANASKRYYEFGKLRDAISPRLIVTSPGFHGQPNKKDDTNNFSSQLTNFDQFKTEITKLTIFPGLENQRLNSCASFWILFLMISTAYRAVHRTYSSSGIASELANVRQAPQLIALFTF